LAQDALARTVMRQLLASRDGTPYQSGQTRFDGQSAIAIYQMAILGLGQIALEHPEKREAYLPAMRLAADRLVDPHTLVYARRAWGHHGVVRMEPGDGHAYLGYVNLGLGMLRAVDPTTEHAALNDRLTAELAARLFASPNGMIETYPGEAWPPDVAAVAGSIGLHARATGMDRSAALEAWAQRFARCAVDRSGYLVQRLESGTCARRDAPRGSGTAVAAYFLSFAHRGLSRQLEESVAQLGGVDLLGFGAVREYPVGRGGRGDTNSGPVLLGVSVGATGFGLGAALAHDDAALFRALFRTTYLFGVPFTRDGGRGFAAGGELGNALLLAMLTARSG
jgi:hypothetical protein